MAISFTTIGGNTNSSGATLAVTVPSGGIPAGAAIFGISSESGPSSQGGSVSDTKNTYSATVDGTGGGGGVWGTVWTAVDVSALTSSNTITWTKHTSGDNAAVSWGYATGVTTSPIDSAVTASAGTSGTSPTVTSGTPSVANEGFVGLVAFRLNSGSPTFTQATGWTSGAITSEQNSGNAGAYGGTLINTGTGTKTYNPTFGSSGTAIAIFIIGLKPFIPVVRKTLQTYLRR